MFASSCTSPWTSWNGLWKDKCWNKFRYICTEQPHWHGDIKKHWSSSGVFIDSFEKIPHLFLVFQCWIWESVFGCFYRQRSKYRQVKITKHASTGTNYAILTKRVKTQYEKKPASNLKTMQILGFEQTFRKFYWDFPSVRKFFLLEKSRSGLFLVGY